MWFYDIKSTYKGEKNLKYKTYFNRDTKNLKIVYVHLNSITYFSELISFNTYFFLNIYLHLFSLKCTSCLSIALLYTKLEFPEYYKPVVKAHSFLRRPPNDYRMTHEMCFVRFIKYSNSKLPYIFSVFGLDKLQQLFLSLIFRHI